MAIVLRRLDSCKEISGKLINSAINVSKKEWKGTEIRTRRDQKIKTVSYVPFWVHDYTTSLGKRENAGGKS